MNPLVTLRALAGLAMPIALAMAAVAKRRERRLRDADEYEELVDEPSGPGPLVSRSEINAHLAAKGNPHAITLAGAQLSRIDLSGRDLRGIDLSRATLSKAKLRDCSLQGANLDFADLSNADLRGADLTGASLVETNLWHADLRGATLLGCRAIGVANFRGAILDEFTRWPPDLDPEAAGARHERGGRH